ncbi:hypothetical protein CC80DRAFT_598493 [Byssothecium circinans]|uniref:Uncharacterized protein n=1 Tax=Byssothecium circinans TaxID=147558 RepID=A0A6A5TBV7_9PLEO|nr:hypothetical protein CC80DRAFT_598493 [Byssothecium circinans]
MQFTITIIALLGACAWALPVQERSALAVREVDADMTIRYPDRDEDIRYPDAGLYAEEG